MLGARIAVSTPTSHAKQAESAIAIRSPISIARSRDRAACRVEQDGDHQPGPAASAAPVRRWCGHGVAWCGWRDSNPHEQSSGDFKSPASTIPPHPRRARPLSRAERTAQDLSANDPLPPHIMNARPDAQADTKPGRPARQQRRPNRGPYSPARYDRARAVNPHRRRTSRPLTSPATHYPPQRIAHAPHRTGNGRGGSWNTGWTGTQWDASRRRARQNPCPGSRRPYRLRTPARDYMTSITRR